MSYRGEPRSIKKFRLTGKGGKMKRYMLVVAYDGVQFVQFFDTLDCAVQGMDMCIEKLGWCCELYCYEVDNYKLIERS